MSQINYMTYKFDILATESEIIDFFDTLLLHPLIDWAKEDEYVESSSGLTMLVYSSRGVAGNRPKAYVLIRIHDVHTVQLNIAQYYDPITHIILNAIHNTNGYETLKLDSYFLAEIWGNKDYVYIFSSRDAWYGRTMFGFIPGVLNQFYTQLTSPALQGTEVLLEVQDSSLFKISDYYQFVGAGEGLIGEGCDWGIQVLDIPDTNHILVNDVPRDYSIGSYFGISSILFGIRVVDNSGYDDFKVIGTRITIGVQNSSYGWYRANSIMINENYCLSNSASQTGVMQPMFITERSYPVGDSESIIAIPHGWLTGDRKTYSSNPTGDRVTFAYLEQTNPIMGITTSQGLNTITDTSQNWQVDELVNKFIHVNIHEADEQIAKIISNTSDTITIDIDWYNTIAVGYPFYVADELYRNPFEHYGSNSKLHLAIYNLTRLN